MVLVGLFEVLRSGAPLCEQSLEQIIERQYIVLGKSGVP